MSHRIQAGFKQFLRRRYLVAETFQTTAELLADVTDAQVNVSTTAGALYGILRADAGKSIIESIRFVNGQNGCDTATIKLNQPPEVPFSYGSIISINLFGRSEPWFCGILDFADDSIYGNEAGGYTFKAKGFRDTLKKLRSETIIEPLQDVADVVRYIAENIIAVHTPINYRASKILTSTGVVTQAPLNLAKQNCDKFLDDLALMSGCRWSVDGAGELNFQLMDTEVKRAFVAGYDAQDVTVTSNIEGVANRIVVRRSASDGDTMTGYTEAYQANDLTSQAQFGVREFVFEVPDYPDSACQLIGDALLEDKKQPKYYAKIGTVQIESADDFLEYGNYRIITGADQYTETVCTCENAADWSVSGTGDLTLSDETEIITTEGVASIKLEWTTQTDRKATFSLTEPLTGDTRRLRFFVRSENPGQIFQIGLGDAAPEESVYSVYVQTKDVFLPVVLDVSDFSGDLNFVTIRPLASAGVCYVDLIKADLIGHRHFEVQYNKAEYNVSSDGLTIKFEGGELPSHMEGFTAQLINQANAARTASRIT